MRTINKIITAVNGKFGAPMGRQNIGIKPENKRIYDCLVPMCNCCGAYDTGGAYWGSDRMGDIKPLRVSYTKDLEYIYFYRVFPVKKIN